MKQYLIQITVEDPYPKEYELREEATNPDVAVYRAFKRWRKENWKGRPLNQSKIVVTKL